MQETTYSGGESRTAAIICDNPERRAHLAAFATACHCSVIDANADALSGGLDFLIADIRSGSDQFPQSISQTLRYLEVHSCVALIWTDLDMLDAVYAAFPASRCHFFVDANDFEAAPILAGIFGQRKMDQLQDRSRSRQFSALHRISDELAHFARTLARIAEQDAGSEAGVSDKPVSFRPASVGLNEPFPTATSVEAAAPRAEMIRQMIKLRRLRDSHFEAGLFADPAWDILLDLMLAQLEGRSVSVSSLCIAAAVPPTTALRCITDMTDADMLVRQRDSKDARRVFIRLSSETAATLQRYLADIQQSSAFVV